MNEARARRLLKPLCLTGIPRIRFWLLAFHVVASQACQSSPPRPFCPLFFVDRLAPKERTYGRLDISTLHQQGGLSAAFTLGDETRRALITPSPSRLTFAVEVPPEPLLRFAIAAATPSGRPAQRELLEFRIFVDTGHGEELCFSKVVERSNRNRWLDQNVDMSRWSGDKAQITFDVGPAQPAPSNEGILSIWGNPVLTSREVAARKPLIVISVDCLRPDHMGIYGYQRETTPQMDAFASEATVFETAVSTSSWTLTTHMSMLTGLNPSFHGVNRSRKLDPLEPYLPGLLSQNGYENIGVVSGAYLSQPFGYERDFHTYRVLKRPKARQTVDEALNLLRQTNHPNVFLFLHIIDPHWHYRPPDEFVERFGPRPPDIDTLMDKVIDREPPSGPEETDQLINLYDAEIAYVDSEVGRFFDELKSIGLYEPALIILTADHGEAFYEHGYWQHSDTLYEEMIRIPLIVKWPQQRTPGRVETAVSLIDLYPTLVEEAGLEGGAPGAVSLKNVASGSEEAESRELVTEVAWHSETHVSMKVALRHRDRKYIATFVSRGQELSVDVLLDEELYHLRTDPGEQKNLLEDPSVDREPYRQTLLAYLEAANLYQKTRQGETVVIDEETKERLKSLGYLH